VMHREPSAELVLLLTNGIPPIHFASTYCSQFFNVHRIEHLASLFLGDLTLLYNGMLPFHCACRAGAPRRVLEWWLSRSPHLVHMRMAETSDYPLHCYASHVARELPNYDHFLEQQQKQQQEHLSGIQYLVEAYPAALRHPNRLGWLPLHLAAMHDAPLSVVFYLARQHPECLLLVERVARRTSTAARVARRKRTASCLKTCNN